MGFIIKVTARLYMGVVMLLMAACFKGRIYAA